MGLRDLVARLEEDARARVDGIAAQAQDQVRQVDEGVRQALATDAARRLAGLRAERQRELNRQLSEARQRARAEALAARHRLLERLLDRAAGLVPQERNSARMRQALPQLLEEALSYLSTLRPLVRCHPEVLPLLEAQLTGRDDVKLLPDETMGPGLVAAAADGTVEVDNTLLGRLQRLRPKLAVELLKEVDDARP
jgi:vacuolar-type H+-ATPase subunit E/Vma4